MILHGKNLIIKAGGVAIAAAKSASIKVQAKTIETSSPSDGDWEHSIVGRKSWSVSTNHLVTSIARNVAMVGTTVTLDVQLANAGKTFSGFVNNVTIQSGTYSGTPYAIYWDKTRKIFVGFFAPAEGVQFYMQYWTGSAPYSTPSAYDCFQYNGVVYTWLSNDLVAEKLTGTAHVKSWGSSGAVGNLLTGQFDFEGTGPLTGASLT